MRYNILDEVEEITTQYEIKKPDGILDSLWSRYSSDTKTLFIQTHQLVNQLFEKYTEAIEKQDWKCALQLCLLYYHRPFLPFFNRQIDSKNICDEKEAEYASLMYSWKSKVETLLDR